MYLSTCNYSGARLSRKNLYSNIAFLGSKFSSTKLFRLEYPDSFGLKITEATCTIPEESSFNSLQSIISADAPEDIYISPVGCNGILRRKNERNLKINSRLEKVLESISSQMSEAEIEKRSRVQKRGRLSTTKKIEKNIQVNDIQISLFD